MGNFFVRISKTVVSDGIRDFILLQKLFKMAEVSGFEILTHPGICTVKIPALFGTGAASAFAGELIFAFAARFSVIFQKFFQAHIR